jgi:hypothetical protein
MFSLVMNFKRAAAGSPSFSSMQAYLGGVSTEKMLATFGSRDADAYWDPEAGYDGDEWSFEAADGQIAKAYARYGSFRIGASNYRTAVELVAWLRVNGFPNAQCDKVDIVAYFATMRAHAAINAMVE